MGKVCTLTQFRLGEGGAGDTNGGGVGEPRTGIIYIYICISNIYIYVYAHTFYQVTAMSVECLPSFFKSKGAGMIRFLPEH